MLLDSIVSIGMHIYLRRVLIYPFIITLATAEASPGTSDNKANIRRRSSRVV